MSPPDLGGSALWTLGPLSAAAGIVSALLFHWSSDRVAVRRATNLILAHMLELRLFLDEPLVVLRAQLGLLRANAQLLRSMLLPALILTVPSIFLVERLNAVYGHAPLRVGEAVVVSANKPVAKLKMPEGIAIETPAVHSKGQVAWRIRPRAVVSIERVTQDNAGIAIPFPPARILGMHWLIWFSMGFAIAAIGTKCLL
jgi:hypothetical protein